MYPVGLLAGLLGSHVVNPAGGKSATAVYGFPRLSTPLGQSAEVNGVPSNFRFPKTLMQTNLPVYAVLFRQTGDVAGTPPIVGYGFNGFPKSSTDLTAGSVFKPEPLFAEFAF
jgi:hypothetical protein